MSATRGQARLAGAGGDLLALLAGALYPLAFAPLAWRPLSLLSLAVFFALLLGAAAPLRRGWCFGLGLFGVGVSWVYESFHLFGQAIAPLAALGTVLFVAAVAAFPAAFGWAQARLFGSLPAGWRLALAMPLCWWTVEWLRGWMWVGFPWLQIGYSALDTPLAALAPIGGVHLLNGLGSLLAGALALLCCGRGGERGAAALAVAAALSLALAAPREWGADHGEPLRVRLVQGNIAQGIKFERDQVRPSLARYVELSLREPLPELLVWPETAVPIYFRQAAPLLADFEHLLAERGVAWIHGGFSWEAETGRTYNTLRAAHAEPPVDYHKRMRVPFGEYMPARGLLDFLSRWVVVPMADISARSGPPALLPVGELRLGASICYDDAFGAEIIRSLPAAQLLLNVSNDGWFSGTWALQQHHEIARLRALESGRPMIRATNNGQTALIDHRGAVLATAPSGEAAVLDGAVQPRSGATPYVRGGDGPALVLLMAGLVVLGLATGALREREKGAAAGR